MKVLTLTEPWATLAALGAKTIETRSWGTRYRGPLAIHVSRKYPKADRVLEFVEPFLSTLRDYHAEGLPGKFCGHIIAVCRLADCHRIDDNERIPESEEAYGDYTPGRFAWILEDIKRLDSPIPAKGHLGLWDYDEKWIFD